MNKAKLSAKLLIDEKDLDRQWIVRMYQESMETFYNYGHNITNLIFWIDLFNRRSATV